MLSVLLILASLEGPVLRTSQVDVTPPELLQLGGYTARGDKKMEEGGDRLYARTLVFEQQDKKIAIVSFEALTAPESLYEAVKKLIPADVHLLLTATHTHSAPDSQMLNERMSFKIPGIASFSRRWLDWYAVKIAGGINQALASESSDASKVMLRFAEVDANRGRREGATPIKTATYLTLEQRTLLTGYAAHGTLFDEKRLKTSGDWIGAVAAQSGGMVVLGPIGDVSPDSPTGDPVENVRNMVDKLRSGLSGSRVLPLFDDGAGIAYIEERIAMGKPVPHTGFAESFGAPPPLDQVLVNRFAPPESSVYLARIGSLLVIGVPAEPTSEVGREAQALARNLGFPHSIVLSHTNGWIGYVLAPKDYDRGGYEATLSFHGRETSTRVIEAVGRAIEKLTQPPRVAQTLYPRLNTAFRSAW